jgi:nucleoside-diphosphate-sugar epimerase
MAPKILVTGAMGIVGTELCLALIEAGIEFKATARTVSEKYRSDNQILPLDLSTPFAATTILEWLTKLDFKPDVILHLAAAVPHSTRFRDEEETSTITSLIDKQIYKLAIETKCHLIYMSTCGLYDSEDGSLKTVMGSSVRPRGPYFEAKLEGENLISKLRYFTIFRLSAPVSHKTPNHLVLNKMIDLAKLDRTIQIWGQGTREQDYIDARDIVSLLMIAVEKKLVGTYNLASGKPKKMNELAKTVICQFGKGKIEYVDTDPLEGQSARYDISHTMSSFSWKPKFGLADSIQYWFKGSKS